MFSRAFLLSSVALACVLIAQECLTSPVTVKVDQTIERLESEFKGKIGELFTKQQRLGDKLIKKGDTSGYALKKLSAIYAIIESFTYAIRRHSLSVAKQIIASPEGSEAARQMPGEDDFSELLEERAIMRGLVDCFQFTVFPWKLMYKYVTHYVTEAEKVANPLKALTGSIFREMKNFDQLGDLSFKRFGEQLEQRKITGDNELNARLAILDGLIDKVIECPQCSGLVEHDKDFYNVYPIFASEEDVVTAVEQYVDPDLLSVVFDSHKVIGDHLIYFKAQEVEAVNFEDVESIRDRLAAE